MNAGDYASILGVFVTIVGFAFTLYNVVRSKSAATRAELAAIDAKNSIKLFDTVADVSKAISMMDEVKRLNRAGEWKVLLDRYSEIKRILIEVKSANPTLTDEHRRNIQNTLGHLTSIENLIEEAIQNEETPETVARINKTISREIEKLQVVLVEVKSKQGI